MKFFTIPYHTIAILVMWHRYSKNTDPLYTLHDWPKGFGEDV